MSAPSLETAVERPKYPGRHFAIWTRAALLLLAGGYGLDVLLSLLILPSLGLDATLLVDTSISENPHAMMAFLSLALIALGHLLLLFALLLWTLARPGFFRRVRGDGRDQIAFLTGLAGLAGLVSALSGTKQVGIQALTYVDAIGIDLVAILTISIVSWVRLRGTERLKKGKHLVTLILAAFVTGISTLAVSVETSWLVAVFIASALLALHEISRLLAVFDEVP